MLTRLLPVVGIEFSILVLLALGFAVGVLGGFFGVGGGWIITPSLHIFGFPMSFAIGTGLANIAGQSALASAKHRKMGNVDFRLGAIVGVSMILGVEAGKRLILLLDAHGVVDTSVRIVYFLLLGGLGTYMLLDYAAEMRRRTGDRINGNDAEAAAERVKEKRPLLTRVTLPPLVTLPSCGRTVSLWVLGGTGLAVGVLAGIMGSGGGFALVPMFVFLIGVPTYVAVSTSLVCVTISGTFGTFTYGLGGRVELVAALWMLAGAAVGTQLGSSAVRYVRGYGIRLLYALMLLLAAASVVMKHFEMNTPAAVAILGGTLVMCMVIIGSMFQALLRKNSGG